MDHDEREPEFRSYRSPRLVLETRSAASGRKYLTWAWLALGDGVSGKLTVQSSLTEESRVLF